MKTIIAGSRDIKLYSIIEKAIQQSGFEITTVISGTANGVDKLGEEYAKKYNLPVLNFPANWDKYGKSAGYIRNEEMANKAEALIAVWDGKSKGTGNMISIARKKYLKLFVYTIDNNDFIDNENYIIGLLKRN